MGVACSRHSGQLLENFSTSGALAIEARVSCIRQTDVLEHSSDSRKHQPRGPNYGNRACGKDAPILQGRYCSFVTNPLKREIDRPQLRFVFPNSSTKATG